MKRKTYKESFYPSYHKATSFILGLDGVIARAGRRAAGQLGEIGWDEETRMFLLAALRSYNNAILENIKDEVAHGSES